MTDSLSPEALARIKTSTSAWPEGIMRIGTAEVLALIASAEREAELVEECTKRGLPVSAIALARHERNSGAFIAGADATTELSKYRAVVEAAREVARAERIRWESAVMRIGDGRKLQANVTEAIRKLIPTLDALDKTQPPEER